MEGDKKRTEVWEWIGSSDPPPSKRFKFKERVWELLERVPPILSTSGSTDLGKKRRGRPPIAKRDVCKNKENSVERTLPKVPEEASFEHIEMNPCDVQSAISTCEETNSEKTCSLFTEVLTLLTCYLSTSEFLRLREVSKTLKTFIDKSLQTHDHDTSTEYFQSPRSSTPFQPIVEHLRRQYTFTSPEDIEKFKKTFTGLENPFISRTFGIQFNKNFTFEQGLTFLETFGKHISHFKYYGYSVIHFSSGRSGSAEDLSVMLSHLPNLQSFRYEENYKNLLELEQSELGKITEFPPLLHLTRLSLETGRMGLEVSLGVAFLQRYGLQLTTLECSSKHLEQDSISPEFMRTQLPNLKDLRIHFITMVALRKLSKLKYLPLQRLHLMNSSGGDVELKHVLQAINPFSETLLQLQIIFPVKFPEPNGLVKRKVYKKLSLPFPNLSRMRTHFYNLDSPWFKQMVKLKFKDLEVLDFELGKIMLLEEEEAEEFSYKRFNHFFECLPKLEKIRFSYDDGRCVVVKREV